MSRGLAEIPAVRPVDVSSRQTLPGAPPVFVFVAWHSLFWLVFANLAGVLIAALLLAPGLNQVLTSLHHFGFPGLSADAAVSRAIGPGGRSRISARTASGRLST